MLNKDVSDVRRRFKFWLSWQGDKLEDFLEESALQGWQLEGVNRLFYTFSFRRSESKKMRYALDCQTHPTQAYFHGLTSVGWVLVYQSGQWFLWQKRYQGTRPDFEVNKISLKAKYERNMQLTAAMLILSLPLFRFIQNAWIQRGTPLNTFVTMLSATIACFLFVNMIQLLKANRALK